MPFEKGKSGNPQGRKPGTAKIEPLRQAIREHVPDILAALVHQAKAGDVGAARLLLERSVPAMRPVQELVRVDMAGDSLTAKAAAILAAVTCGQLSPMDGKALLDALGAVAKIQEIDELLRRIEALEAKQT